MKGPGRFGSVRFILRPVPVPPVRLLLKTVLKKCWGYLKKKSYQIVFRDVLSFFERVIIRSYLGSNFLEYSIKLHVGCIFLIPIKSHFGMYFGEGAHGIPWGDPWNPMGEPMGYQGVPMGPLDPWALGTRGPLGPGPSGPSVLLDFAPRGVRAA